MSEWNVGKKLNLREVGVLSEHFRGEIRTWLEVNFGEDEAEDMEVLPDGGFDLPEYGEEFSIYLMNATDGTTAYGFVVFGPLGQGFIYDLRVGEAVAELLDGDVASASEEQVDELEEVWECCRKQWA